MLYVYATLAVNGLRILYKKYNTQILKSTGTKYKLIIIYIYQQDIKHFILFMILVI